MMGLMTIYYDKCGAMPQTIEMKLKKNIKKKHTIVLQNVDDPICEE